LSACAWIDAKQRELIYRPTPGTMAQWQEVSGHDEAIWLDLPRGSGSGSGAEQGERVRAIWIPQPSGGAPAVLYLHGTFRNVFQNRSKIAAIHAAGFSVLAVDYRGWGESTTRLPSEASIMQDAERTFTEFARRVPQPNRRVIYGHSMGTGVAVELASRHRQPDEYGALVLESAFTSLPDIARDRGGVARWFAWASTQHFKSLDKIDGIDTPKWFITGANDNTVPTQQSQRLYEAARDPRHIVVFPGGSHSSLHEDDPQRYHAVWRDVAAALRADAPSAPLQASGAASVPAAQP